MKFSSDREFRFFIRHFVLLSGFFLVLLTAAPPAAAHVRVVHAPHHFVVQRETRHAQPANWAVRRHPESEPAAAHYRQALALAVELGMRPLQAHCHRGLGTLYATIGQQEQARAELSAAMALYRSMDMTFWLAQTEAALAQMEGR